MTVTAPTPPNETERLAALRRFDEAFERADRGLDGIVRAAARQFRTPIAAVSLVEADRQVFKSSIGVELSEVPRDMAFCAHAVLSEHVLLVLDATKDPRFANNPFVTGAPGIRFYAGAPLITAEGHCIGTLCVIDTRPHDDFSKADQENLAELASLVIDRLEMQRRLIDAERAAAAAEAREAALRESEERFSGAFETSPIGMAIVSPDGAWLKVNKSLCEIVGYGAAELCATDLQHVTHPDHLQTDLAQVRDLLAGKISDLQTETRYLRRDGTSAPVLACVSLVRDSAGEPLHLMAQITDLSDRKRALRELESRVRTEENLAAAEHRLELFFEHAPVAVAMFDREMRYIAASHRWRVVFDIWPASIAGESHFELVPHLPASWRARYERGLMGDALEMEEDKVPSPDGGFRWVRHEIRPWRTPSGAVGGLVVFIETTDDRKAAEAELDRSRQFMELVLQSVQDGIIACDAHGELTLFNDAALRLHGLRAPPSSLAEWAEICDLHEPGSEEPLPVAMNPVARALAGWRVGGQELVLAPYGGERRRVVAQAAPMLDGAGEQIGAVATIQDVTDERLALERWREANARYRAIFDHTFQFCGLLDAEGTVLEANETALRFAGLSRTDVIGVPVWDSHWWQVDEETRAELRAAIKRAGRGAFVRYEVDVQGKDGVRVPIDFSIKPIADEHGVVTSLIVEGRDISDKRQSEQALRASEERHRQLYKKTPVMLHSVDREGRLVSVSDLWLEKLGYAREEVIGRKTVDFLTPESRQTFERGRSEFIRSGFLKEVELQIVSKSGTVLDVLLSAVADYDEYGDFERAMSVLTDVTERKVVERQLIQAQKMESVGQLTGGLAHDFNNLLAVILGNLQLLEHVHGGDERSARWIAVAERAVDRGAELTRRLLAFSRRQKLETRTFSPNPLVESLEDMLRRVLGESVQLDCRLGADLPNVRTDPSQLETAILNLAVNARDAMPGGGALTISTSVARLGPDAAAETRPGRHVVISVTDTGIGIPPENIERVFEPFFTTKEIGKGSGLGLSMVYGLMKQSGGHARVESALGEGTTVRLYLPVDAADADAAPDAAENMPAERPSGVGEKVLVVEDQEDVREIAVALVESLGYAVVAAPDGPSGLAMIETVGDIDLLFTDIVMPGGMNGVQLAAEARRLRPDLPVVFTTGYAQAALLHRGDINASVNLVTKPFRREDLAVKLRQALDARNVPIADPIAEASKAADLRCDAG